MKKHKIKYSLKRGQNQTAKNPLTKPKMNMEDVFIISLALSMVTAVPVLIFKDLWSQR